MSVSGSPNILLIIADDLGADKVIVTDRSPRRRMYVMTDADGPNGPKDLGLLHFLSILMRNGLYFEQAWAQPACSPTRGAIYSGTWPWRNGVGSPGNPKLDADSVTALPKLLEPLGYQCGIFGKWHLGKRGDFLPTAHGWHRHIGTIGGAVDDYRSWEKVDSDDVQNYPDVDPLNPLETAYVTKDTVEEAGSWINSLASDIPWFATIAFHAPHDPMHDPETGYKLPRGATPTTDEEKFNAMAQNMDFNIGRLLGSGTGAAMSAIPQDQLENTVIIFTGDNGSWLEVAEEEEKTTIYEGGVRIPMIVADGTSVAAAINGTTATPAFLADDKLNKRSKRMVNVVDLYETIAEICSVESDSLPEDMDSVSLWRFPSQAGEQIPTRSFNFAQFYNATAKRATIRNKDYKLNCEFDFGSGQCDWSYYAYFEGEIPGLEDASGTAYNIFDSALADLQDPNISNEAADNLAELFAELIDSNNKYAIDDSGTVWDDPR